MARYTADVFVEYMVKKKRDSKDYLMIFGGVVLSILLVAASVLFLTPIVGISIPFMLTAGVCFGLYYLIGFTKVEYEYAFTNGDLTIDKIINMRSRKRLTGFETNKVEDMGYYAKNADKLKNRRFDKTIIASENPASDKAIYIIAPCKKTGNTLIVFDPSERILDSMKMMLPSQIRVNFFVKNKDNG